MNRTLIALWLTLAVALPASAQNAVSINATGGTFPAALYSKWCEEYHREYPSVQINYKAVGSSESIQLLLAGAVDVGGSDRPMTDEQIAGFRTRRGVEVLHFATTLGAAVPAYNVPGISTHLNFTADALAGIFLGRIKRWNDPAIASANEGTKLPAREIVVVHGAEGRGTTYIWTDYLSKVSEEWKQKVGAGTTVNWPVGLSGKGNDGMADIIARTPNSIGYIELTYALNNNLLYGNVANSHGNFVNANPETINAAAAAAAGSMPADFRVSITDGGGNAAYPVSSFTWLLVPARIPDPAKRNAIKSFLQWMLSKGQVYSGELHFGPLPRVMIEKEMAAISRIQ